MPPKERKIELNIPMVGGIILAIAVIVLLVVSLMQLFRKNPYGPETRIDNIEVVDDLPQTQKDQIFAQLYSVLKYNLGENEPPASGAIVREGTVDYGYNEDTKVYSGSFIVDVPSVEQSYKVQLDWSPEPDNMYLGGYPVLITCVPKSLQIYESQTGCIDSLVRELSWENAYQLDYTFGATTSQRIRKALNDALIGEDEDLDALLATVDELSFEKLRNQPDLTYQYDVKLRGKTYKITTRVDMTYGNDYVVIYVDGETKKQGIVLTDDDSRVEELSGWLRELSGGADLEIVTEKLSWKE